MPETQFDSGCTTPYRRSPNKLGLFGALGTVLGARLLAIFHALQVERAAHDVVTHTWQILYTAAAHEHNRVLLQVVAFAADVGNDFETVRQTNLGNFTQRRVRFLWSGCVNACAHATALWAVFKSRALAFEAADFARLAHELANGRHDLDASFT